MSNLEELRNEVAVLNAELSQLEALIREGRQEFGNDPKMEKTLEEAEASVKWIRGEKAMIELQISQAS